MLEKIVSGGQTGADRGALDAALAASFPCGGWCPRCAATCACMSAMSSFSSVPTPSNSALAASGSSVWTCTRRVVTDSETQSRRYLEWGAGPDVTNDLVIDSDSMTVSGFAGSTRIEAEESTVSEMVLKAT